ncbi:hypothetical protein SLE2022_292340 [Rubroshorea leprosula]
MEDKEQIPQDLVSKPKREGKKFALTLIECSIKLQYDSENISTNCITNLENAPIDHDKDLNKFLEEIILEEKESLSPLTVEKKELLPPSFDINKYPNEAIKVEKELVSFARKMNENWLPKHY